MSTTTTAECSIEGCPRTVIARGWCKPHWNRWRKYGDPLGGSPVGQFKTRLPCQVKGADGIGCGEPYYAQHQTTVTVDGKPTYHGVSMCEAHYTAIRTFLGRKLKDFTCEHHPDRPAKNWANDEHTIAWCTSCYDRAKLHGDPLVVKRNRLPSGGGQNIITDEEALDRWVDKSGGPDACWPWTDSAVHNGYGRVRGAGRDGVYAHVLAYKTWVGPVPDGWQVDHLCHNRELWCVPTDCRHRLCCNPSHLEPVTGAENLRRAGRRRHEHRAYLAAQRQDSEGREVA